MTNSLHAVHGHNSVKQVLVLLIPGKNSVKNTPKLLSRDPLLRNFLYRQAKATFPKARPHASREPCWMYPLRSWASSFFLLQPFGLVCG